jgi:SsrA-binding protein
LAIKEEKQIKIITENRRARHEYHFLELYEAGIELLGTEVKSLRNGKANLQDAYAKVENGEVLVHNMHISPYEMGNRFNHDPKRPRRLLLHKSEINRLYSKVREKGWTLIPSRMYFLKGRAKLELALAQGKRLHDKRNDLIKKEAKRDIERTMKEKQRI